MAWVSIHYSVSDFPLIEKKNTLCHYYLDLRTANNILPKSWHSHKPRRWLSAPFMLTFICMYAYIFIPPHH